MRFEAAVREGVCGEGGGAKYSYRRPKFPASFGSSNVMNAQSVVVGLMYLGIREQFRSAARLWAMAQTNFFKGVPFHYVVKDFVAFFGISRDPALTKSWSAHAFKESSIGAARPPQKVCTEYSHTLAI